MRIPEELVPPTKRKGKKLVCFGIVGSMVHNDGKVTIDTTDAGAVVHIFDLSGIVRVGIETFVNIVGKFLSNVVAMEAPAHVSMTVVDFPKGWATIDTGYNLVPRSIFGP
jgi:pyruvate/2-oxoglutarate/acetoin dehydrogenase E1 component